MISPHSEEEPSDISAQRTADQTLLNESAFLKRLEISSRVSERWDLLFFFMQLLSVIVTVFMTKVIFRTKVHYPSTFTVEPGTLVICNHQSRYDPFLISYHLARGLRPNIIATAFPMRYPVLSRFMKRRFLGLFIFLFGGYNIGTHSLDRMKGLLYTMNLLERGITVLLFPEGKIVKSDTMADFNGGLDMVLQREIPVRLVRMKGMYRWSWFTISKRHQVELFYSETIRKDLPYEEKQKYVRAFYRDTDSSPSVT